MVFEKDDLRKILKDRKVKDLGDYNNFLSDLSKQVVEILLEEELTDHLGFEKYDQQNKTTANSRNGTSSKKVKSKFGNIGLSIPRDRNGEFEPRLIKKGQRDMSGLEEKVISMYARGMTTRDIQDHLQEIYNFELSAETISKLTDRVLVSAREWQNRPLEPLYSIIFMDALQVNMRLDGIVRKVSVYNIIGVSVDGYKQCLGMWISETESAKFWLKVLNDLRNRGLEDVLIFSVDNLRGISESIKTVYPKAEIQKCIVHQLRNSFKNTAWKDRKKLANDLKTIYKANTEQGGLAGLNKFEEKWDKKYPHISASWRRNWKELSTFFKYPKEIRTLIYTTNPIESLNRCIRKISRNKVIFPNEQAVIKVVYLVLMEVEKKWSSCCLQHWSLIYSQLLVFFKERIAKYV